MCGECAACAAGRYNICRKLGFVGLDGQQGGFAEQCVVGSRWIHPLGDIPTDLGALVDTLPSLRAVAFNGGTAAAIGRPLLADRDLALITLPSSSPLHTIGLAAKQPAWTALAERLRG